MNYIVFAILMFLLPPVPNAGNMISILIPFTTIELIQIPQAHILPIILMFVLFASTTFFGAFAEILTQRLIIDAIPNKIRNNVYSLSPTILLLLAIPQISIFGWLIPIFGFPPVLTIIGIISLVGVVILQHGLKQERIIVDPEIEAKVEEDEIK